MAICTKCGTIMHQDDADKHVCKAGNLPTKGTEKIPQSTSSAVI